MLFNLNTMTARLRFFVAITAWCAALPAVGVLAQEEASGNTKLPMIRITTSVPVEMSAAEIAYWQDPDFRRRFVESYLAETDIEPKPTTQEEVDAINEVLGLMSVPTEDVLDKDGRPVKDDDGEVKQQPVDESPEQVKTRLQGALDAALKARENDTFSVLIDFMIANLYLNISMNLPEPAQPVKPAADAAAQEQEAYQQAFEAYEAQLATLEEENQALLKASAAYYRRATVDHPKYRRAWRNLGLVHIRLKDYENARVAFGQVIMLGGGDPDTYGLMGFCYTSQGKHLPAESAYRMANMLDPGQINWELGLIRSFLLQERYPEAVALTGRLLENDPTDEQLWLFQANAFIGMNQIDKALKNYEILNGLGKSTFASVNLLANIYTNKGLYDTAVGYYQQAIDMANPSESVTLRTQLLRSARVLSTRGEAARDATKALIGRIEKAYRSDLEKKDLKELLMLKARIATAEGDDVNEAKMLEEVVQIDPLDGEALLLLGQFNARQFKALNARSDDPEHPSKSQALDFFNQAVLYFERAEDLPAEGKEKLVADTYVRHAQLEVAAKRPEKAVPLLKKSLTVMYREGVAKYLEGVERMR